VELEYALARWPEYKRQLQEQAGKDTAEMLEGGGPDIGGQTKNSTYPDAGRGDIDKDLGSQDNKLLERILASVGIGQRRGEQDANQTKYVKISETWFKDFTTDKKEITDIVPKEELLAQGRIVTDGVQLVDAATRLPLDAENWPQRDPIKWDEPRFPNGRYILRTGETILNEDEADQRYPHHTWPFITSPHYIIPFMWQGSDAVQLVKTSQDMINVSISHLVNHMKQFGDPKIAVERGAIDSPKARDKKHFRIGSGAGAIIRLARGGLAKFKIVDPPSSSPVIGMLYTVMSQEFKNMVGLQDIAQGKKSAGDLTATESSYLAMSAQDRISLQMSLERLWIQRIGTSAAEICQHHYEPERLVRILGENAIPGVMQITQGLKEVRYDVHVQVSSTMPFDAEKRIARYMQANSLLVGGPPSPMLPELLRVLEIPNWRKVLERHALWLQWMEFQQMMQGVQQGQVDPGQAMMAITEKAKQILIPLAQRQSQMQGANDAGKKPEAKTGNGGGGKKPGEAARA